MVITNCTAKEILDSRGVPTVEVAMASGAYSSRASVPSGKSTGSKEALEKRDVDGRGVSGVIASVNEIIAKEIVGRDLEPNALDRLLLELDGTDNKSNLGANAMLGVSIAATKLAAAVAGIPVWKYIAEKNGADPKLPKLFMNVMNGGAHSDFRLPFQEYIIVPEDESVSIAYEKARGVLDVLGAKLKERFGAVPLGDEGGYAPKFETIEEPFALLEPLISKEMFIAIDAAASGLYENEAYHLLGKRYSKEALLALYEDLIAKFPLKSIEDPFEESGAESFSLLVAAAGEHTLIVGDDLTVSNPSLITEMAEQKAANAVIIKPNQIGTLLEAYEAVTLAHGNGWKTIASHRSGETMDSFIADFAVGVGAYGIKAGSPLQKERKAKYDRLLEIENEITKLK